MPHRWIPWGPAALWAGVLFFLSAVPGHDRPPLLFLGEDKVAHVVLYAVLGAALAWGRVRSRTSFPAQAVLAVGFLFAVSDEWHQGFVPGRHPDVADLGADTLGLLLGYRILSTVLQRRADPGTASTSC